MCFIWMITITVWANRSLRQCFGGWTSLKYCCELRLWVEWVWGGTLQTMQLTMFLIKAVYCVGAELSWVCSMAKQYGSRTREDRCEWVSTWLRSIIVNVQLCWAEPHYHTVLIVLTHSHSSNIQLVNLKILMAWLYGTIIILLCLSLQEIIEFAILLWLQSKRSLRENSSDQHIWLSGQTLPALYINVHGHMLELLSSIGLHNPHTN